MARKSIIGVSDEVVKDQILDVFSPVLSDCEVFVECFAGNVMVMVSGSKDGIQYVVDLDVRDLVFAWEGDYFEKFLNEKLKELQVRIGKRTRLANPQLGNMGYAQCAHDAVNQADWLIAELNKEAK